ncbi:MAG: phosphomannose isomerase type II C-terminal cupin domain [Candidatus Jorgensenbacteria bacterium]
MKNKNHRKAGSRKRDKTILKPWGGYEILEKKPCHWIKKLFVRKGEELSLQSHKNRREIWIVLSGKIEAVKGSSRLEMKEGDLVEIGRKEKHRIIGIKTSQILEITFGKAREKDIIRFKDDYGRIK